MHDFIIIGSGSAGGTMARNLQLSGAKTLLLEAGKYYKKETFPDNEMEYSAKLFWGGGLEFDKHAKTAFLRAKMVGGTTIVNQSLSDRFDDIALDDWRQRSGVDWLTMDAMSPYYDKAEAALKLHTFEPSDFNKNAQKFTKACEKLGYEWKPLRRGMHDCALDRGNDCITCLGGCFRDSKQSSLVTAIQLAEKEGLEIKAEFEVGKIEHKADHVVIYGDHQGRKETLKAKKVILCGGSFGSTKIMFNSGFKSKLPALGKGFCQHPQYMMFGLHDEIIDAHKGSFQTVYSKDPKFRKAGFKLENVYGQTIGIAMLFKQFGKDHHQMMRNYRKMTCIEAAVRDQPEGGEMTVDNKGNLVIEKILTDQDKTRRDAALQVIRNIFEAQGAKKIYESPFYFGLHLMGGCAIGVDKKTSVVAPDFQVHDHAGLYIVDTSLYPSAPGINPSLTVSTLAHKLSEQLTK
ncbi:MAG: GMC family oxidoreductase [Flavobacteriales bacterium]|nr:GMC family oxidoreductase [Flavobacteriales bacterium]